MIKKTVTLSVVLAATLYAQPNIGDAMQQQKEFQAPQREVPQIPKLPIEEEVLEPTKQTPKPVQEQQVKEPKAQTIEKEEVLEQNNIRQDIEPKSKQDHVIKGFEFFGNESISDKELHGVTDFLIDRELNAKVITAALKEVQMIYRAQGFDKAKAYAFTDSVVDGVVGIAIRAREHEMLSNDANRIHSDTKLQNIIKPVEGIFVRKFDFEGNEAIRDSELRRVVSINEGRTLDTKALLALADEITEYYASRGFMRARAFIYKDDISEDGVVKFTIRASKHEEILQDPNLLSLDNPLPKRVAQPKVPPQKTPTEVVKESMPKEEVSEKEDFVEPKAKEMTLQVESFIFEGNTVYSDEDLATIVSPYKDQPLSFSDLEAVASTVTRHYRRGGYFVARAFVPAQTIEDDIVTIQIVEGNYGEFHLQNSSLVSDATVQAMLDDVKDRDIVSTDTLERAMLIINDTPGSVVTQADVGPGSEVGTSDFMIATQATNRFDGYIVGDNYGSRYTGKERVSLGVNVNSPFGIGDKIAITSMLSNKEGLKNIGVDYSFLAMPNGLRANVYASHTEYELGKEYKELDAIGKSNSFGVGVDYPLIRSRLENLNLYANLETRSMKDEIKAIDTTTKKSMDVAKAGMRYSKNALLWGVNTQSTVDFSYTTGRVDIKSADAKAIDKAGANTQGSFHKLNLTLQEALDFQNNFSLLGSLRLQYALDNKNLDGSEDMSIGGAYGVRVYPSGEESAENGYLLSVEGKYTLPTLYGIDHSTSLFYDVGRVGVSEKIGDESSRTLQSIGVGYSANYQSIFANMQLAQRVGSAKVESEPEYNSKFLMQIGYIW
ncbi:MAG: POTRA domain-containing protein [Campylobacterota bacterium]